MSDKINAPRVCGGRRLRLLAAAIPGRTLFFKFTGAEEPVDIFETVGQEPWGRHGSGVVELVVCASLFALAPGMWAAFAGVLRPHRRELPAVAQKLSPNI